jgi:predicted sugar kinase
VRTLLSGHGFHLSKAQNTCQITNFNLSGSRGALQGAAGLGLFTPQLQTSEDGRSTSEKCQMQTHAPQQIASCPINSCREHARASSGTRFQKAFN